MASLTSNHSTVALSYFNNTYLITLPVSCLTILYLIFFSCNDVVPMALVNSKANVVSSTVSVLLYYVNRRNLDSRHLYEV